LQRIPVAVVGGGPAADDLDADRAARDDVAIGDLFGFDGWHSQVLAAAERLDGATFPGGHLPRLDVGSGQSCDAGVIEGHSLGRIAARHCHGDLGPSGGPGSAVCSSCSPSAVAVTVPARRRHERTVAALIP